MLHIVWELETNTKINKTFMLDASAIIVLGIWIAEEASEPWIKRVQFDPLLKKQMLYLNQDWEMKLEYYRVVQFPVPFSRFQVRWFVSILAELRKTVVLQCCFRYWMHRLRKAKVKVILDS